MKNFEKLFLGIMTAMAMMLTGVMVTVIVSPITTHAAGPRLTKTLAQDANNNVIQVVPSGQLWDGTASVKAISNLVLTSNVVTLTTSTAHGYAVGQRVDVLLLTGPALFADCNGTFVITVVGSSTTFSYAFNHAEISTGAATGSTTEYQLSPILTGTTQQTLKFPPGAMGLTVIPTAATDATYSFTTSGGIGGLFPLYQGQANYIPGTEGDIVYVQRTTTTPLAFIFSVGK